MSEPQEKKPYRAPKLIVYGDIRTLTLNANRNSVRDGGGNNLRT
jgi:hypothetical protein